jgi:hypothetical protein
MCVKQLLLHHFTCVILKLVSDISKRRVKACPLQPDDHLKAGFICRSIGRSYISTQRFILVVYYVCVCFRHSMFQNVFMVFVEASCRTQLVSILVWPYIGDPHLRCGEETLTSQPIPYSFSALGTSPELSGICSFCFMYHVEGLCKWKVDLYLRLKVLRLMYSGTSKR